MGSFYGLEAVGGLTFQMADPRRWNPAQLDDVTNLVYHSLRHDFGDGRTTAEISTAVAEYRQHIRDIGRIVKGGAPGTSQRYTKPATVAAYDQDGRVKAVLSTAMNASSRVESSAPRLEIWAKEHLPRSPYYYWAVGMVAVAPELRPEPDEPAFGVINLVDIMLAITMYRKTHDPNLKAYSLREGTATNEEWLEDSFRGWRLRPCNEGPQRTFGSGNDPITEVTWAGATLEGAEEAIMKKEQAEIAVERAFSNAIIEKH